MFMDGRSPYWRDERSGFSGPPQYFFFFLSLSPVTYRKELENGKRCIAKSREIPLYRWWDQ
jgi:hypothetical protein